MAFAAKLCANIFPTYSLPIFKGIVSSALFLQQVRPESLHYFGRACLKS